MINSTGKTRKLFAARQFALLLAVVTLGLSSILSAATLQEMTYATLPGAKMEIRLVFDGAPPEVTGYTIDQPARIALDLMGASSGLTSKYHNLDAGNTKSITVVEAQDRTRLIISLLETAGYTTEVEGNELVVTLGSRRPTAEDVAAAPTSAASAIEGVDFRRGSQGEGQVIINLSNASIPVDIQEQGGRITARFVGAELPAELQRRLDVTDFATPVRFVDTRYDGQHTVMIVEPQGAWEYLAYQADDQFTINVKPLSQSESSRRQEDAFQYAGEKLSLSFQDIEVRSVLQLIADFTGLNLVASDTVEGKITLRLQNVPWDQALDLILKTKGLDKRQVGNVLLVAPADEIAQREALELESQRKVEELAPLRSEYIRINYAKAEDLTTLIQAEGSLLSGRGSITYDERTNTIIVQDTVAKLDEIREVISILDVEVQQVLIEARVVIASNNMANEIGVRWGGISSDRGRIAEDGKGFIFSGDNDWTREEGLTLFGYDVDDPEVGQEYVVDLGVADATATRFSLGFLDVDAGLLEVELSALDSEGQAELVATPKVLTADQQPALIASGQQIGYREATSSGAAAVSFKDAELRLEVTPAITPEGKVIMDIAVNNDALDRYIDGIPVLDSNRLQTSVLVDDGETVVLGGIFQQNRTNGVDKTPLLGDLPWIGNLFRRKIDRDEKQELLIFITPRLVRDVVASN